ncbi:hypothetical protein DACRYDRAFT_19191 [Dacryopinax primogenitus]|uniref:Uncharacterized protein n=1 Tax=Dacryopinax primogenitus (strain DJM 731) TaxID=1858805 RepID=M5FZ38_DACPD|nr:uncharacterized protein DACRYDRAFT_19191 [Dacryopinax primogenitus]EJT96752.1 hypothetical protein DACRYDRAFT_19191 [Dacryopinax primogenitus]
MTDTIHLPGDVPLYDYLLVHELNRSSLAINEDSVKGSKLTKENLTELREIWERDRSMPNIEWRKAWAASHGLRSFANVTQFFKRKMKQPSRRQATEADVSLTAHTGDGSSSPHEIRDETSHASLSFVYHYPSHAMLVSHKSSQQNLTNERVSHCSAPSTPIIERDSSRNIPDDMYAISTPQTCDSSLYSGVRTGLLAHTYTVSPDDSFSVDQTDHDTRSVPLLSYSLPNSPANTSTIHPTPSSRQEPLFAVEDDYNHVAGGIGLGLEFFDIAVDDQTSWMKVEDAGLGDHPSLLLHRSGALDLNFEQVHNELPLATCAVPGADLDYEAVSLFHEADCNFLPAEIDPMDTPDAWDSLVSPLCGAPSTRKTAFL